MGVGAQKGDIIVARRARLARHRRCDKCKFFAICGVCDVLSI
ncbi:hypothetical protein BURPS1106B_A2245 [Burkholderia pseudomallei 1106b]|uniref:Uncharacterized protein n=1 Tax=Burkholderia pseudomallei 1710a TaxID=320371 RepID=A0A0E1W7G0_BURPE|nr:hypothetical protein BUH_3101 [Burkholderia pseudomallei Pakistan 9]EES24164.1 hypothetical protein BURPS1106B_A2245 [Burkholderia pseudomallei 1106b]EET08261.1 hypothetical protein BURPS1710A_3521 [Burkholderia pseudomallei 1710a]